MWTDKLMWIAWPAFLAACVLELVVFALVDPAELSASARLSGWSRQGVYTAGFFAFWAISAIASTLTAMLAAESRAVARRSEPPIPEQEPAG